MDESVFLATMCAVVRPGGFLFWPILGACAGVYLFCRGFLMLRERRLILNTPSSKIRSAAMGMVEVSGLACGPYTVTAPVTGVPCYYYRTLVWQWRQSGKNSDWQKVVDDSLHVPFYLDDNTGKVLVNPQGAEMDIHRDFHEEFSNSFFSTRDNIPAGLQGFLLQHGVGTDKKIKVEEYCIKPKNALFVLGTLAVNPGLEVSATPVATQAGRALKASFQFNLTSDLANPLANLLKSTPGVNVNRTITITTIKNGGPPEVIRLSGNNPVAGGGDLTQQSKISAALIKAGITNPAAWAAAGVPCQPGTAVVQATDAGAGAAAASAAVGFDLKPSTVLMKGKNNPAFLISWRSQREVVRTMGWKSTLMIWGGPALTLACIYILTLRFGWL